MPSGGVLTYQDFSNPNKGYSARRSMALQYAVVGTSSSRCGSGGRVNPLPELSASRTRLPLAGKKERQTYLMTISHLITNSPNQKVAEPAESETKKPAIPAIADGLLRDQETPLRFGALPHGASRCVGKVVFSATTSRVDQLAQRLGAHDDRDGASLLRLAMNGKIHIRGRNPGEIEYEDIPRDTWRLAYLQVREDKSTIWRVYPIPRTDVKPEQIQKLLAYDSLSCRLSGVPDRVAAQA